MQRYSLFFTEGRLERKKTSPPAQGEVPLVTFTAYKQHLINTLENVMKLLWLRNK